MKDRRFAAALVTTLGLFAVISAYMLMSDYGGWPEPSNMATTIMVVAQVTAIGMLWREHLRPRAGKVYRASANRFHGWCYRMGRLLSRRSVLQQAPLDQWSGGSRQQPRALADHRLQRNPDVGLKRLAASGGLQQSRPQRVLDWPAVE